MLKKPSMMLDVLVVVLVPSLEVGEPSLLGLETSRIVSAGVLDSSIGESNFVSLSVHLHG